MGIKRNITQLSKYRKVAYAATTSARSTNRADTVVAMAACNGLKPCVNVLMHVNKNGFLCYVFTSITLLAKTIGPIRLKSEQGLIFFVLILSTAKNIFLRLYRKIIKQGSHRGRTDIATLS